MDIIFGVTTLVGVILTIYYGMKSSRLEREKKSVNWSDLQSCANDMGLRLKHDGIEPDFIITPGLRGATFVNLLANELKKDTPCYVGISIWKGSNTLSRVPQKFSAIQTNKWTVLIPDIFMSEPSKNILIVDDFAMSGDFIESLVKLFVKSGFQRNKIKTMAIVTTKIAIDNHKQPDYYWRESLDTNFYFPWGKAK